MVLSILLTLREKIRQAVKLKHGDHAATTDGSHETSAAGRALQIYDIVACIIEQFDGDSSDAELKAACAKAALVSRSFAEPASQMLWRELSPDLDPFWRIFRSPQSPQNAWRISRVLHGQEKRIYTPEDEARKIISSVQYNDKYLRQRFYHCASHVRRLHLPVFVAATEWILMAILITKRPTTAPLFPALQELHLHTNWIPLSLSNLIPRHLRRLNFVIHHDETYKHAAGTIDLFRQHVPDLSGLRIEYDPRCGWGWVSVETLQSLCKFQALQSLNLEETCTPWRTLLRLIAEAGPLFHQLLELSVHLLDEAPAEGAQPESHLPVVCLPRLQHFACVGTFLVISSFVDHLHACALTEAKFPRIDYISTPEVALQHFHHQLHGLSASCFSSHLHTLHLTIAPRIVIVALVHYTPFISLATLLSPLFSLPALQDFAFEVAISPTIGIHITDDDLAALARAWPALRALDIRRHPNALSAGPDYGGDASLRPSSTSRGAAPISNASRCSAPSRASSSGRRPTCRGLREDPRPLWEEAVLEILERRYPGMWTGADGLLV
ncbi:uncharacterized protein BXZ73DRAFT_81756 [Epithele typhae]|uniref:uncharacterized protein n=1 Tax=Epithele typhae TaxID=378194 RepID=UPI002007F205|nr:uncharacterized protein BXZ73DRAFT_81756 [Epithele typhae]KAH9914083.1 hypothetical protein BXZ73DRAFT_81756 [Epithele typhae]